MSTLFCLALIELCATNRYLMAMIHKALDHVTQCHQLGTTVDQSDTVHREGSLQLCHLEELVQHHIGVEVALHINDDTHTLAVALVIGVADTLNLVFVDQIGNIPDEFCLVHAIGYLADNNLVVGITRLNLSLCTHDNTSATSFIGVANTLHTINICTCGEVWSRNILHQTGHIDIGIVNIGYTTVNTLAQVMRGDVCSHTYGNTRSTIDQQVREKCRQHAGLLLLAVEVVHHIYSVLLQVLHHSLTRL